MRSGADLPGGRVWRGRVGVPGLIARE